MLFLALPENNWPEKKNKDTVDGRNPAPVGMYTTL